MSSVTDNTSDAGVLVSPVNKYRKTTLMLHVADSSLTSLDFQILLEAGMNATKFRMSHTSKEGRLQLLGKLQEASLKCCEKNGVDTWPIATCMALKTAIMKTGILKEELSSINIDEGSQVMLTCNLSEFDSCDAHKIFVDNLLEVNIGTEISIGEEIVLNCKKIMDKDSIICKVSKGGRLCNLEKVIMRGVKRSPPPLSNGDYEIIKFALEHQVDMLIVHYVRQAQTLKTIKKFFGTKVKRPFLISSISTQQGLDNIDDIAKETDAILLSRNYMPFELEASKGLRLGQIQKWLGAKCEAYGKPYFIAGDIFQDTLNKGEHTGREMSDVANALLDGASGFILEGPDMNNAAKALKAIDEICRSMEPHTTSNSKFMRVINEIKQPANAADACILGCVTAAYQVAADAIIVPTVTGYTVQALLRLNPPCTIIAVSTKLSIMRMLISCKCIPLLYKGVAHKSWQAKTEARIQFAIDYAVNRRILEYGDVYVTLKRHSEYSIYSDTVQIFTTIISKKPLIVCPDPVTNKSH